jgi:uncharacterized protein YecE (DUF72 family)
MIRVGVAGWDYPDWEGIVYPSPLPRGFDRLSFLADCFDSVEINVTFYRQPDRDMARSWASRVASRSSFRFTAKLYREMTHLRRDGAQDAGSLVANLKPEADRFLSGIDPIVSAGLLGALLVQFPYSFHDQPSNRDRVAVLIGLLPGLPIVVEFRHRSWDHDGALRFLHEIGAGFCNVDQPALGANLRPTGHVTSRVAYVRLHGRNAETWFRRGENAASRYDYFYSMEELKPWIDRVERLGERAEEVFVIANNHYRGKGPANGLMLRSSLERKRVRAPADLVSTYPALADVTIAQARPPAQGRLF